MEAIGASPTKRAIFEAAAGITVEDCLRLRIPFPNAPVIWNKIMVSNSGGLRFEAVNKIHHWYRKQCPGGHIPSGKNLKDVLDLIYADYHNAKNKRTRQDTPVPVPASANREAVWKCWLLYGPLGKNEPILSPTTAARTPQARIAVGRDAVRQSQRDQVLGTRCYYRF
jgi:hypothetical protein